MKLTGLFFLLLCGKVMLAQSRLQQKQGHCPFIPQLRIKRRRAIGYWETEMP